MLVKSADVPFYQANKINASALQYIMEKGNSTQYKCNARRRSVLQGLPH